MLEKIAEKEQLIKMDAENIKANMEPAKKRELEKKHKYRVKDIELRMKILCDVEIEGKMLDVYTECLDGAGEKQGANKWVISKATEIDFRIPIFNELYREDRPKFEKKL